ncbi:COG4 transport protein [Leishmania donovani]|uniref:COG4 transport family protein n=1 Tax=Leishmania donovani TaxID=5661 RepID=A0A504XSV5_LEIDO|nr:hypothetical protein, conserved [Leishmania donovani]TPP44070.1 COG4 transport family protein [Leishmania donovani]TPP51841.1 COG4 transport family protein [Leishmania donovani]CAJ1986032.1 COG4 transport protein [Leishmania donovani]CBZ31523.1 hypothetical protein, conserved [Leishmania donovani]VDZ41934.1 COG4_transport_protein_putative/Pfam:PF08318 [Leishmania donovani]
MLLKHIDNVEERFDQALQRVRDGVRRRDAALNDIRQSIHAESELHTSLREISNVQYRLMPQYVHRSAALARTVAANASLAERSSKRVRRLDALLQRVQQTCAIVDAMKAMENDAAQVSSVLDSGDIDKILQLLHSYEAAQRVLTSASPATVVAVEAKASETGTGGGASLSAPSSAAVEVSNAAPVSDVMRHARATVQARLLRMIEDAVQVNDKLAIMKGTKLLAELGEGAVASRLYSDWIADHTIAALAKLIDGEMRKMEDSATVAMTHLALVSQCLDNVAAAFESDEEFTYEAFGAQGPLVLLAKLHSRATARCVPVLSDFIERRKDVLAQLEKHALAGDGVSSVSRVSTTSMNAAAGANVNAVVASARRADQILEEISHMVSCGHIYLTFVERKQTEYEKRMKASGAAAAAESGREESTSMAAAGEVVVGSTADNLWRTSDNALLNSMQDILAVYVPLQTAYFTIAYDQAVDLQLRAIRDAAKEAAAAAARAGGGGASRTAAGTRHGNAPAALVSAPSAASFMSGLQSLYMVAASSADELIASVGVGGGSASAAGGGASAAASEELASFWYFTHNGQVTLPDDVFFVLRMAIHRAMNTKSAQICSAAVISAMDVVQLRLLPEIESHTVIAGTSSHAGAGGAASNSSAAGGRRRAGAAPHGGFLTPDELHWTGAAQRTATYLQRMADELQQLGEATFSATPHDVTRFRELAGNMRTLGRTLQEKLIPAWLDAFADVCCDSVLPPHMERFAAVSYDMKEEVYYHYELNDVWVQACLVDLGAGLQYLHQHLADAKLFDALLTAMARRVAKGTSSVLLRKRVSLFGALQVDKDVRALRSFFVERAQNDLTPIRDAFTVLSLMATLLLSDKPTDALEEAANTALTADEKKKVLLTRVEFRKEAVMALPL